MNTLVEAYEARDADWREVEQARFVINAFTSALARPTPCAEDVPLPSTEDADR